MVAIAKKVQHPAGKTVVEEDESAVGFHLILEGTAEASTGGTVVNTMDPGATTSARSHCWTASRDRPP